MGNHSIPISSKGGFDSVFTEIEHGSKLELANPYHFKTFCLKIDSNKFSLDELYNYIQKNIGYYVFSRSQINDYDIDDNVASIGMDAVKLLRKVDNPKDSGAGGELGEILLYLFLEQVLHAPRLISKLELKTSANDYIKKADGLHFFSGISPNNVKYYQLVIGESKTKGKIRDAVNEAFISIKESIDNPDRDVQLINTELFKESFDNETNEFLMNLIVPNRGISTTDNYDTAFGIFIGYNFIMKKEGLSNIEYREQARKTMAEDIKNIQPHIMEKIAEYEMSNHSFYFYFLPFNDIMNERRLIISKLKWGSE